MSQENVDIVRRMLEASDRRDGAAVFAVYDPEIAWDVSEPSPTEPYYEDPIWMGGVFRVTMPSVAGSASGSAEVTDYEHEQLMTLGIRSSTS